MVKSGSSPGSGFTNGKGLRPRSGAIAVAAAAKKAAAAARRARGATLGPAARSERLAPGGGVGEGRGERAVRTRLPHCWRGRARAMELDLRAQNSHAHGCSARQLPANLRYRSPRSAVTTPQLHRRKLLKNGGRFPPPPHSASSHTNLLPCGAGGECSNRRRAGQRSQPIGSKELPLCSWVPPPSPTA